MKFLLKLKSVERIELFNAWNNVQLLYIVTFSRPSLDGLIITCTTLWLLLVGELCSTLGGTQGVLQKDCRVTAD